MKYLHKYVLGVAKSIKIGYFLTGDVAARSNPYAENRQGLRSGRQLPRQDFADEVSETLVSLLNTIERHKEFILRF